jgi:hypothetical protein
MSDFDWGNQLFTKISGRNIVKIGEDSGSWKSLDDIRTVISFGLTRQPIKRDFLLNRLVSLNDLVWSIYPTLNVIGILLLCPSCY